MSPHKAWIQTIGVVSSQCCGRQLFWGIVLLAELLFATPLSSGYTARSALLCLVHYAMPMLNTVRGVPFEGVTLPA